MKKQLFTFCTALLGLFADKAFSQTISTIAGTGTPGFSGDGGAATAAQINQPLEICIDGVGNIYFADWGNHRVRKITPAGIITTIAGTGVMGFSGDGGPATAAQLNRPYGIIADNIGNVYFSDEYNHRIRKITPSGTISTIAGTGITGFSGDGGPATAANIWFPLYMGIDAANNLYFADNQNQRIRKITPSGIISTVAGNGIVGYTGDGGAATAARLNFPGDITTDASGNILFCDGENACVRKINSAGIISTIAGTGVPGFMGDGGPATVARLNTAQSIAMDNIGNIYVSDLNNHRVRKINTAGIISTVVGTGLTFYNGDGIPATTANINSPRGMWVDPVNNVYVAEGLNHRIRKISPNNYIPSFTTGAVATLNLCIDELPTPINSLLAVSDLDAGQTLTWSVVTAPSHGTLSSTYSATSTGGMVTPTGTTYMPASGYTGTDIFKVQVFDGTAYDTITINVTVMDVPSAGAIAGASTVCIGSSISLSSSVPGGIWSNTSGTSFVSTFGVVTGITAGLDVIQYVVSNMCGSDTAVFPVTVAPLPDAGAISGIDSVCVGNSVTLAETVTGGAWSDIIAGVATVGGSGIVTGATAGIDTIVYTVTNSCGSATAKKPIKVLPLADAGVISGIDSVCPGKTITLSETVTGGSWSHVVSGITTVSTTGVVSGTTPGVDTIVYSVTNSCGTAKAKRVVKVLSPSVCQKMQLEVAVLDGKDECTIYPNPSSGRFNVLISSTTTKELKVTITDVTGRKLEEYNLNTNTPTELSTKLAPGAYLLNVISAQGAMITQKIIVTPQEP